MESKQELFERNMSFAYWFINRYFPALVGDEDIAQIAFIGLWKACNLYDESKGKFTSLASICIRNEIIMELRKQNARADLYRVHLDDPVIDGEKITVEDTVEDKRYRPDCSAVFVKDLIKPLSQREKQVVACRVIGLTQRQAAEKLGMSQGNYCKILKAVREKLRGDL